MRASAVRFTSDEGCKFSGRPTKYVEIDRPVHTGTSARVVILPDHPLARAKCRRPKQAPHPKPLARQLALEIRGIEVGACVDERAPAIVTFKGVEKARDLPNNIADFMAGAAGAHMLGIDNRRQRTVLTRYRGDEVVGLFGA